MSDRTMTDNVGDDLSRERDSMVGYIRRQLLGPSATDEILPEPPASRYLLGLLFPKGSVNGSVNDGDILDEDGGAVGDEVESDPVALSGQFMPSSVGISFMAPKSSSVTINVAGAFYRRDDSGFARESVSEQLSVSPADERSTEVHEVFDGRAEISILWRPGASGVLATVALVNSRIHSGDRKEDELHVIAQVELKVAVDGEGVLRYPSGSGHFADDEEAEQELLYRDVPTYAVGHGCAADWSVTTDGRADCVWVEFLPTHTIPGVSFEVDGSEEVRRLERLAEIDTDREGVGVLLRTFVSDYGQWIEDAVSSAVVPAALEDAKRRISSRLESAHRRMSEGVELLLGDAPSSVMARRAFAMANRAMASQMRHSQADAGGSRRTVRDAIDPTGLPPMERPPTWRPFQLAFLLLTIPSTSDGSHPDRDLVDLIWFPTGGGKTEAYLGLVAYEIIRRRMAEPGGGGGTAVITRYTLRLLTTQQFQRAAALTCALELMRRGADEILGSEPISIGLWVGGGTTPNSITEASELLEEMKGADAPGKSFQVEICPWCGTEVIPENAVAATDWGVEVTNADVRFRCPNSLCPFSSGLPVQSVDDCLYSQPPTFLIATIDKFARFAWDERPGAFFGGAGTPPPSLVIQDELHLISGPLGTVAAIYEAAFDLVMGSRGSRPKVVASTATIRRAGEQVKSLFDRDVFLFPPSGTSASDSYFVRSDPDSPGRRYVGVMAQSHTPTTGAVHTMAALLQAPVDIGLTGSALDTYWTLVCYHNSLRELGKTVTLARDDVPARAGVIAQSTDDVRSLESDEDLIELTSNVPSSQIPRNLETLMLEHGCRPAVSVVAATNMISVGVDVPRLGLMMVVGQPKSTSEYIQASSRVGRDPNRPPGLVVTLYSAAKPRDRSHYERFRPYHESIYRSVEPTSVTPWALPARERALHAALVIIARHMLSCGPNDAAGRFVDDAALREVRDELVARAMRGDPREADAVRAHVDHLVVSWIRRIQAGGGQLKYLTSGRQQVGLLRRFTSPPTVAWPTLDSMRNVDHETIVKVGGRS
jgi:hypothetical protein